MTSLHIFGPYQLPPFFSIQKNAIENFLHHFFSFLHLFFIQQNFYFCYKSIFYTKLFAFFYTKNFVLFYKNFDEKFWKKCCKKQQFSVKKLVTHFNPLARDTKQKMVAVAMYPNIFPTKFWPLVLNNIILIHTKSYDAQRTKQFSTKNKENENKKNMKKTKIPVTGFDCT